MRLRPDVLDYDIDSMREPVEKYYYDIYQANKTVENEINYIESRWLSDMEILVTAERMGIDTSKYKKSKHR